MHSVAIHQLTIIFLILVMSWIGVADPGNGFCKYVCKSIKDCPGSRCLTNISLIPSCENLYRVFPINHPYTLYSVQDMSKYGGVYRIPCGGPVYPIGTFIGQKSDPYDPSIKDMIHIEMKFDHYSRAIETMKFYGAEVYRDGGIGYETSGDYLINLKGFGDPASPEYFRGSRFFFSSRDAKLIHADIPNLTFNETMVKQ